MIIGHPGQDNLLPARPLYRRGPAGHWCNQGKKYPEYNEILRPFENLWLKAGENIVGFGPLNQPDLRVRATVHLADHAGRIHSTAS